MVGVAAAVGMFAALAIGIGCFHCGTAVLPFVAAGGSVAAAATGVVGWVLRRRLLESRSSRVRAAAAVTGAAAGVLTSLVLWNVLFNEPPDTDPAGAHRSPADALPAARRAARRHVWPGTTALVRSADRDRAEIQRRWLGLPESTVTLTRTARGWTVQGVTTDIGWLAQVSLGCLLPACLVAVGAGASVHRRSVRHAARASGSPPGLHRPRR